MVVSVSMQVGVLLTRTTVKGTPGATGVVGTWIVICEVPVAASSRRNDKAGEIARFMELLPGSKVVPRPLGPAPW